MKQTREAAIFAWAADGADFLDRASLNRLKKTAPVAMLRGRAGFVTHGPDSEGYIHVSLCGDCRQDSRRQIFQAADLDEPLDKMSEEAWKALCDKHDADEAQGLDLAAFTKVLIVRLSLSFWVDKSCRSASSRLANCAIRLPTRAPSRPWSTCSNCRISRL